MNDLKISVQRGLKEISDLLVMNGYEVCEMGHCNSNANVNIVSVSDYEYEGIGASECRIKGDGKVLVINSANYTPIEILNIIKNKNCNCAS